MAGDMGDNLAQLSAILEKTMDPTAEVRRPAEKYLENVERTPGYALLLMRLLESPAPSQQVRLAAALTLKNFVRRNWETEEAVTVSERAEVRRVIVELMMATETEALRRQLAETIALVGRVDFPARWPELLPALVGALSAPDYGRVRSCLWTAHALTKRYRTEMRSNELWAEIKLVLEALCQPLTALFARALADARRLSDAPAAQALPVFECLLLVAKLYYSLNAQDLAEFFEDHLDEWMSGWLELLRADCPAALAADGDEAGVGEQLKSAICDAVAMFAQKYEEEFAKCLPPFVQVVWQILVSTGALPKYDGLVSNAMQLLASVCQKEQYKQLFEADGALQLICERVVVPNAVLRPDDEELFDDNPDEFVRRDLEAADADTRRRAAADLVRALCRHFERPLLDIFGAFVGRLLDEYARAPPTEWRKKDAALFLVTALASRGSTQRHGATHTSSLVDLADFCASHVLPELDAAAADRPALQAAALKYLVTFRERLPADQLRAAVAPAAQLLLAESVVVRTYAAHALERLLVVNGLLGADQLRPSGAQLLTNLFGLLEKAGTEESEYGMKCVMRLVAALDNAAVDFSAVLLQRLTAKLLVVAKNPSRPHFNHYLFDSVCAVARVVGRVKGAAGVDELEAALFPPFELILQQDVAEFLPYVFQVLALLLDLREARAGLPAGYLALYPCLMAPALWQRSGVATSLVCLLRAFLRAGADQLTSAAAQLNPLLGVVQRLVASRSNDHDGFDLLNALVQYGQWGHVEEGVRGLLLVLFNRLQSSRTAKFARCLVVSLMQLAVARGGAAWAAQLEAIQPGLLAMVVEKVMLRDMQKVAAPLDKKLVCVGATKVLADCADELGALWPRLLEATVGMLELPEEAADEADGGGRVAELEESGYSAAYSQLAFARRRRDDPTGVADCRQLLAKSLHALSTRRPLEPLLAQLDPVARQHLGAYVSAAGAAVG